MRDCLWRSAAARVSESTVDEWVEEGFILHFYEDTKAALFEARFLGRAFGQVGLMPIHSSRHGHYQCCCTAHNVQVVGSSVGEGAGFPLYHDASM